MLSGCAIIVRGQPRGGPPPERQINLSNIRAGNLARRAAAGQPDAKDTPDEVGASCERCHVAPLPRGLWAELDGVSRCCWLSRCKRHHPFPCLTRCWGTGCSFHASSAALPSSGACGVLRMQGETVPLIIL